MTTNTPRLTDAALRQALAELAAGPDADMLLTDVLRSIDSRAQVARRLWDTRGWGRAAVLVVAALLLAAAIGTTVVLMRPEPSPQPDRTPLTLSNELIRVPDFFAPFVYRMPVGMSGKLEVSAWPDGFYSIGGSGTVSFFGLSGNVHGCPIGHHQTQTDDDLAVFLRALDEGPISATSLGGLPAWTVAIDPEGSDCRDSAFHLPGLRAAEFEPMVTLSKPGRLIVASTGEGAVGVLISAPDETALSDWLPVADALVNGIEFDAPALSDRVRNVSDFVVPFTYRMPVGIPGTLEVYGSLEKLYFIDARAAGFGELELFPLGRGVHGCGSSSGNGLPTSGVSSEPAASLEQLRDKFGAGVEPVSATMLGNLPASAADIDPSLGTCARVAFHIDGLGLSYVTSEPALNSPGRLIVASTGGGTIGVLISAPTDEKLVEWLPLAQALVDGMNFEAAP